MKINDGKTIKVSINILLLLSVKMEHQLEFMLIRDLIKAKNNLLPYRNIKNNLTFKDLK